MPSHTRTCPVGVLWRIRPSLRGRYEDGSPICCFVEGGRADLIAATEAAYGRGWVNRPYSASARIPRSTSRLSFRQMCKAAREVQGLSNASAGEQSENC